MSRPLSPAAQAVLTELTQQEYGLGPADIPREAAYMAWQAAITARALADHVASPFPDNCTADMFNRQLKIRHEILAIADELQGHANG
jgi:hypothetical protein